MQRPIAQRAAIGQNPGFQALIFGLHGLPAPALGAGLLPIVKIIGQTAGIYHGIDSPRAANAFATRPIALAPGQTGLGHGLEFPIHRRVEIGFAIAQRQGNPGRAALPPRLE